MVDALNGVRRGDPFVEHSPLTASASSDAPLLPEPSHFHVPGGDPGAELAKLVLESAREDKQFARGMREAEERAQTAAEGAQLAAMERKADAAYASGILSGASTAASGVAGVVGAGVGSDRALAAGNGVGKFVEGGGRLGAACFDHKAQMADMAATHEEQIAGRHRRAADDARDEAKDAKELIDRAISFYKEYTTATNEAQRAALVRV